MQERGNVDATDRSVTTTVHLTILGKVQGVFFRSSMKNIADQLGVNGWTRNLPDGSVEALLQGDSKSVHELVTWCRRGPEGARVDSLKSSLVELDKVYHNFIVLS